MNDEVKLYSSGALVSSATIMTGEILSSGCNNSMFIFKGGIAEDTVIYSGTSADVSEGGIACGVSVYSEGGIRVLSGGVASDVLLLENGTVFVHGGVASNVVNSGTTTRYSGDVNIASGGSVYHVSVSGTGDIYIFSSGYAEDVHVSAGGHLNVGNDDWSHLTQERWGSACSAYISSGGELHVGPGGQVTQTTILSGGKGWVSSGGTANSTTVNPGGSMFISSGCTASAIKENGGYVSVADNAETSFVSNNFSGLILESGQSATLHSGTTATETTINSYAHLYVYGGFANGANLSSEGCLHILGDGTAKDILLKNGTLDVYGGIASNVINSSIQTRAGGDVNIASGGKVYHASVSGTGDIYVFSKGYAEDIHVYAGGHLNVGDDGHSTLAQPKYWGSACSAFIYSGGEFYVGSGGQISKITVYSGGRGWVSSGGTMNSTTVNSGGSMFISSGCTASAIKENGGFIDVASGAIADFVKHSFGGLVLNKGESATLHSGTTLCSGTVNSGGKIIVFDGGKITDTILANGDAALDKREKLLVHQGGIAENINVSKGCDFLNFGYASHTILSGHRDGDTGDFSDLFVRSGGVAEDIIVYNGGHFNITSAKASQLLVSSGGTAEIEKDGFVSNVLIAYGGSMGVYDRGTVFDTHLSSGGVMYLSSGAIHSGILQFEAGATVSAYQGAIIDFTVAEQEIPSTALINNWSLISGGADVQYTLTTKNDQAGGIYTLAEGASDFNSTVTVKYTDGTVLDTLAVGEKQIWDDKIYSLNNNDGHLNLSLSKRAITITANSASKMYDGTALTASDYTFAGELAASDELVVTVSGSITDAGSAISTISCVKVMRGEVDVTEKYNIATQTGTLEVTKRSVTLASGDASKVYDGTPLTDDTITVGGDGFADGEGYTANVTGSQLDAGSSPNTFTYTLNDGTKAANYDITTEYGTLEVAKITTPITITANSASKMYDGTALTASGYTYTGTLAAGDDLVVTLDGTLTDAGSAVSTVASYKVMRGTADVTANYTFSESISGKLEVTKRSVTLTSGDASKVYDGTPLTDDTITVGGDGFADGEGYTANVTGSQLDAGSSPNTFTYTLNDGTKAANYDITTEYGTLEVAKITTPITITANSASKMYDGTALTASGYTYTGTLAAGDDLVVTLDGTLTDAGSAVSTVASYKVMRGTADVTANYTFSESISGTLEVTKRSVTLASGDASKVYDGTPLTDDTITVGGDGWAAGEGASCTVTGTQTEVGSSKNTFTYTLNDGTLESNYIISTQEGTLTVTKPAAKYTAKSDVDGSGVSDVMFQYTGGDYQIGFWMNGTNTWQGQGIAQAADFNLLGAYDMDADGNADAMMIGYGSLFGHHGVYVGYYSEGTSSQWHTIGYLDNPGQIEWKNAVGNLTGNDGANSIVWQAPDLGALGVWTDGSCNWVSLGSGFNRDWTMLGCGDFDGNGKDEVLFEYGGNLYTTDIDQTFASLGGWGTEWQVKAIGDFSGDGKDDLILQSGNMVVKFADGKAENWSSIGVMDASDWFIVGAGDYNGDEADDLLVRQTSTGMLGYYANGDMSRWVEMGRGVDMNWTVIA